MPRIMSRVDGLLIVLIVYCCASLFHFVHNAVYIDDYPNLPAWISVAGIYLSWLGITSIGVVGYLLLQFGWRVAGLASVGVYGSLGLDGPAHYRLAPMSAHTFTMNLSIWSEAVAGVIVLVAVTYHLRNHFNRSGFEPPAT